MNRLKVVSIVVSMFFVMGANAQKASSAKVVSIQTNGTCQACKDKIEQGLAFEKGVKDVEYDLATSIVKVTYNEKKTDVETIRKTINKLGYTADGQKPQDSQNATCHPKKTEKHSCEEGDGHEHGHKH
ncbi:MAG: cation transporter [Lentimicrobiaceae bacterium]|nr:cation transporter [Lentimicrobiaceae bacterium]